MRKEILVGRKNILPRIFPFYYGWVVVALSFLTTLTVAGVRASPSVLIHPLETEFGWSRTAIASVVSMNLLIFGIAAPVSGWLIDRYGPRKVMIGSLIMLTFGVSGTIVMSQFWQFFLVWGIVVGIGAGGVGSVLSATVGNRWFVAKRGLVLGILSSASSTGQLIFLPLFMVMVTYAGWRMGSMALIIVVLMMLPMIYLWMCNDPSDIGLEPYGFGLSGSISVGGTESFRGLRSTNASITLQEVFSTPTFWLLAGSFFVCGGTSGGLIGVHLIPHEIDLGISQLVAASVFGIMGGLNFVGTVLSGWMTDKVQPKKWLAMVYALRGLSLLILPFVRSYKGLFVFAVIFGLDWFATVPPTMAIASDTFGKQNIGKVYGWIFMSHQIGAAIMATTAGAIRVRFGDYHFAFIFGGIIAIMIAFFALQIRPVQHPAS